MDRNFHFTHILSLKVVSDQRSHSLKYSMSGLQLYVDLKYALRYQSKAKKIICIFFLFYNFMDHSMFPLRTREVPAGMIDHLHYYMLCSGLSLDESALSSVRSIEQAKKYSVGIFLMLS